MLHSTSGHADAGQLKDFAKAIDPHVLVPVHTEHAGDFMKNFKNVRQILEAEELIL